MMVGAPVPRTSRSGTAGQAELHRAGDDKESCEPVSPAPGFGERSDERVQVSCVDDRFFVVGRGVEAGEEVVERLRGDGEGVGVLALVPFDEAPQQFLPVGREVDHEGVAARLASGPLPVIAVRAAPQPMVEDDIVSGFQFLDEPLPNGFDDGAFAIEVGVLGVVDAVPAVEPVHLLVHGQPGEAEAGQGLGDGGLPGAGQAGQENGEGHVVIPSATSCPRTWTLSLILAGARVGSPGGEDGAGLSGPAEGHTVQAHAAEGEPRIGDVDDPAVQGRVLQQTTGLVPYRRGLLLPGAGGEVTDSAAEVVQDPCSPLERAGLVTRRRSDDDQRSRIVALTRLGRELIDQAFTDHMRNERRLLDLLTPAETKALEGLLTLWPPARAAQVRAVGGGPYLFRQAG